MNDSNSKTIDAYSKGVEAYVNNTAKNRTTPVNQWIDRSLAHLNESSRILELGSAYGRDANYIESLGYKVERTDVVPGFVDILKTQDPEARVLDAITDPIDDSYDLVIANAVFLHFTFEETKLVAKKVLTALNPKGKLAISLKQGTGEEWVTKKGIKPRFFHYWEADDISSLLAEQGYGNIEVAIDESDKNNATWLMVIAQKI